MIAGKVSRFVRNRQDGDFDTLVREAFQFQYDRLPSYQNLCRRQGIEPTGHTDWRDVPAIPALAYKTLDLSTGGNAEVFRSSGTTTGRRSVHRHSFPDLYRSTIDESFPGAVLGSQQRRPILSLIPDRQQAPDSSLSFMAAHVLERWGSEESRTAFGERGVDARAARSFLGTCQRHKLPILVLSTAFALVQLLEALDRFHLRFRLPPNSVVFETGGYKGRSRIVPQVELETRLEERLGLPASSIVREYGMTELTSQFYTGALSGGDANLFTPPYWTRVRILDPETLQEVPQGTAGLLCIFDLANLSSTIQLLTEDLGTAEEGGFRLVGRAAGAELRGCSLTVEELTRL